MKEKCDCPECESHEKYVEEYKEIKKAELDYVRFSPQNCLLDGLYSLSDLKLLVYLMESAKR